MFITFKLYITSFLRKNSRINFIFKIKNNSRILDVGCGNNSPFITKTIKPNCAYHGIDIHDYNQNSKFMADKYIIAKRNNFHNTIGKLPSYYDYIICNHNLEHVDNRKKTLLAMLKVLKKNGSIYLAFPSDITTTLPSRKPILNYYDDITHKGKPPNFDEIINTLHSNGFSLTYSMQYYQPKLLFLIGFALEPISRFLNVNLTGTWVYNGFESIIIAKKTNSVL